MESIREIYTIGHGPSSSHSIGPRKAAGVFRERYPHAASFRVTLFGSLAATGKGHQTDSAILSALAPVPAEIVWKPEVVLSFHTNGMNFQSLDADSKVLGDWTAYSIGGGKIVDDEYDVRAECVYELTRMNDILQWMEKTGKTFWEYVEEMEGEGIYAYLADVWTVMRAAIVRGIDSEGIIPGGLRVSRKAAAYFIKARDIGDYLRDITRLFAYALAVAEENAIGGEIVTAPTCGSCGVLPSVLKIMQERFSLSDRKILRALATAGLFGNIVKKNASISGAHVGCQGEIGTACAMAAAAATQLMGGTPAQIEYAAEMGMEHHLGLTCDPIGGLVQIPCIERNAFAAERAFNTAVYAMLSDGHHNVSFDKVVKTMNRTGHDLPSIYKETSTGGLAVSDGEEG